MALTLRSLLLQIHAAVVDHQAGPFHETAGNSTLCSFSSWERHRASGDVMKLSESQTHALLINPQLLAAGWKLSEGRRFPSPIAWGRGQG